MKFKIGTRKSLLAKTQCNQTKDQLEKLDQHQFALEYFVTEGDQKTDKALWQLEGKDFFTKELDLALLNNKVDLNIHSYKDLGSDRPKNIQLAATPKRQIANDILFIRQDTIKNLHQMTDFVIGTSSPRREVNLLSDIHHFIPNGEQINFSTKVLRGNVNTRIEKLLNRKYDAIVLAYAGIERLASSLHSKKILIELLKDTNFIILPQTIFPSAASQGALAIEKNSLNQSKQLDAVLAKIHHKESFDEIQEERRLFQIYGGGCHLAVGIYVKKTSAGTVTIQKGQVDGKKINKMILEHPRPLKIKNPKLFIGMTEHNHPALNDQLIQKTKFTQKKDFTYKNIFVTSANCIDTINTTSDSYLFCGGLKTWSKLIQKNYWVNGCGAIEGEKELIEYINSNLMKLYMNNRKWSVLTSEHGQSKLGATLGCYSKSLNQLSLEYISKLKDVEVFYWTSFQQYNEFCTFEKSIENRVHCCGLGKTYQQFIDHKVTIYPFFNADEFYNYFSMS